MDIKEAGTSKRPVMFTKPMMLPGLLVAALVAFSLASHWQSLSLSSGRRPAPASPLDCGVVGRPGSAASWREQARAAGWQAPRNVSWQAEEPPRAAASWQRVTRCPSWFRHIEADLRPWEGFVLTEAYVEEVVRSVKEPWEKSLRVQIVGGQLYATESAQLDPGHEEAMRPRATFILWGLLMLLRRFPGQIPDVDLVFYLHDRCPSAPLADGRPPLLACACAPNRETDFGFIWPDWTFWGWPELRISGWEETCSSMAAAGGPWRNRTALAYWKGNPGTSPLRQSLMECDPTDAPEPHPFRAELRTIDWGREGATLDWSSVRLENECKYRYVIYAEGFAWSVSYKYALCCGSTVLAIAPEYHDFFGRALLDRQQIVVVPRGSSLCTSIKDIVDQGNEGSLPAEQVAQASQKFAQEDLAMENVYGYMFHAMRAYAMHLGFAPKPSRGAEFVSEDWFHEKFKDTWYEPYFKVDTTQRTMPCIL